MPVPTITDSEGVEHGLIPIGADDISAVAYTQQTLTAAQKAQARENINALGKDEAASGLAGTLAGAVNITAGQSIYYALESGTASGYYDLGDFVLVFVSVVAQSERTYTTGGALAVVEGLPSAKAWTPLACAVNTGSAVINGFINTNGNLALKASAGTVIPSGAIVRWSGLYAKA